MPSRSTRSPNGTARWRTANRPSGWASLAGPDDVSVTGFAPVGRLERDVVGVGELGLQRLAERGGAGLGLADLAEVLVERDRLVPPQDREAELAVEAPLVGALERRGDA